jgi:hypothetical protein
VHPERFELLAFCFVAIFSQNPNGSFVVAYEARNASQCAQWDFADPKPSDRVSLIFSVHFHFR